MVADVRATAARVLGKVLMGNSLNQILPPALDKVAERDRSLLQQLCYGTLREGPKLQAILDRMMDKPLRERDRDVQGLLLCGLYQLQGMRIPDHAAVSATVAATRSLKKAWARGMTNALLRRFLREKDSLLGALDPAATASHPAWLYRELTQQWPEQAEEIIAANNGQPPMTLRVNASLCTREEYLGKLQRAGIAARPGKLSPESVTLAQARDVLQLPGFTEGLVSVQDEAAQLAAHLLQAQPGERVLDACAAPGGKSCHILALQAELAQLVATDIDPHRLARVEDNLQRLGVSANLLCSDATAPDVRLLPESFDRILVDAPCSASGVIRRHPDVKLLRTHQDIQALGRQQLKILQGLWPLLCPGGALLYATCSILEQENDQVIEAFLNGKCGGQGVEIHTTWGVPTAHGRQLLPAKDGTDGLFYALIRKTT